MDTGWITQLGLEDRTAPELIVRREQLEPGRLRVPRAYELRRTWDALALDAVWCIADAPMVYFKSQTHFDLSAVRRMHRRLWNEGQAPILVIVDPHSVYIISTLEPPTRDDDEFAALAQTLDRVRHASQLRLFTESVESGELFKGSAVFDVRRRVDRYLLANLDAAVALLTTEAQMDERTAQHLLLALVFTCYLIDRAILLPKYLSQFGTQATDLHSFIGRGSPSASDVKRLHRLFASLHRDFNGDFFAATQWDLNVKSVEVIQRFLANEDLGEGQLTLGAWMYDFSAIPIETLSEIYQRFLRTEQARRDAGAYYTPKFLAEAVLEISITAVPTLLGCKYLDPACGSGIFLVGLFQRLVEEWKVQHPDRSPTAEDLRQLLTESIFGVDKSESACRVAALSLYLAFLDQLSARDVQALQRRGEMLPKLLGDVGTANIYVSDFFKWEPDDNQRFDLVVGNPPWVRTDEDDDDSAAQWLSRHGFPEAQNQLAYAFMFKAPTHCTENGITALILPASLLFNRQRKNLDVQRHLFTQYNVERIVNLCDLRLLLFEDAKRPAVVVVAGHARANAAPLLLETPKASPRLFRADVLALSPQDSVAVPRTHLSRAMRRPDPQFWKVLGWGSPRDKKFLTRLSDYGSIASRLEQAGWEHGEGFNVLAKGQAKDRPFLHDMPFLPSKSMAPFVISRDRLVAKPPTYAPRQPGRPEWYRGPKVLFTRGAPTKLHRYKAAFVPFDCSFRHAIRVITGPAEAADELRFVASVLASRLAAYWLFYASSSWGVEREQLHAEEILSVPYSAPKSRTERKIAQAIIDSHHEMETLAAQHRDTAVETVARRVDALVGDFYELDDWERMLVDDFFDIAMPSLMPARHDATLPALGIPDRQQWLDYMSVMNEGFRSILGPSGTYVSGTIATARAAQSAVLHMRMQQSPGAWRVLAKDLDDTLTDVRAILAENRHGLVRQRDLKVFVGEELYVVKPLARRNWTRSAAQNDFDEIASAILLAKEAQGDDSWKS